MGRNGNGVDGNNPSGDESLQESSLSERCCFGPAPQQSQIESTCCVPAIDPSEGSCCPPLKEDQSDACDVDSDGSLGPRNRWISRGEDLLSEFSRNVKDPSDGTILAEDVAEELLYEEDILHECPAAEFSRPPVRRPVQPAGRAQGRPGYRCRLNFMRSGNSPNFWNPLVVETVVSLIRYRRASLLRSGIATLDVQNTVLADVIDEMRMMTSSTTDTNNDDLQSLIYTSETSVADPCEHSSLPQEVSAIQNIAPCCEANDSTTPLSTAHFTSLGSFVECAEPSSLPRDNSAIQTSFCAADDATAKPPVPFQTLELQTQKS